MTDLGAHLREQRANKAMTLEDVERLTGILPSTLSRIETGETKRPTVDVLLDLAALYGLSFEKLALMAAGEAE